MIKNYVIKTLSSINFIDKYFSEIAIIFMLHRVNKLDPNRLPQNENMKVTPEFLEKFILELYSKGYEFISLDELYEILKKGKDIKKKAVITFDDGYKDNYYIAYPLLKKYSVPFTVYITTSFPQKEAILWWYVLEDLILENNYLRLSNGLTFECCNKSQKEKVFLKVREIIKNFKKENFLSSLNQLLNNYKIDWFKKNEELCLTWDEIVELSKDKLVTIGNHTKSHLALNRLNPEELKNEIIEANKILENKISKKVEHFAYPFGSPDVIGKRELDIINRLGFKTATTTKCGFITNAHNKKINCLPRFFLTDGMFFNDVKVNILEKTYFGLRSFL
jgi:peptidoglycan/xylan/chitin deacetylase (PgdA/CDA1 family)